MLFREILAEVFFEENLQRLILLKKLGLIKAIGGSIYTDPDLFGFQVDCVSGNIRHKLFFVGLLF